MKSIINSGQKLWSLLLCLTMCIGIVLLPVDAHADCPESAFPDEGQLIIVNGIGEKEAHLATISADGSNDWTQDLCIAYIIDEDDEYGDYYKVVLTDGTGDPIIYDDCMVGQTFNDLITNIKAYTTENINNGISANACIKWVTPSPTPEAATSSSSSHQHSWTHGVIYEATETSDGLEGDMCSCGAVQNTNPISAHRFACDEAEKKLDDYKKVPTGTDYVLDMGRWNSFPRDYMESISSRSDVNLTIKFEYNHKKYEVYIPAGTTVDTSLEWYGPLKLMEMFEYKQLN